MIWPHGSTRIPVDQLAVGDIVIVHGAGAYRIAGLRSGPVGTRLAVLDWDDLALILRPGTTRERLNPAPAAGWRATAPPAPPRAEDSAATTVRPHLPLAG